MGVGQPVPTAHSPWKPSALHWPAGGRSARDACPPPSLSPASISLPSALTSLTSHPISLLWGEAGKGVIRSCPPLHLFPLTPLPTLIPYPGLLSSPTDGELPTRGASPPPTPALMPKAPLPNWGFSPQIGNRKHSALSQPNTEGARRRGEVQGVPRQGKASDWAQSLARGFFQIGRLVKGELEPRDLRGSPRLINFSSVAWGPA